MPRLRVWGLSAVLAVGAAEVATAQGPRAPEQTTLANKISSMFAPKKPKPSASATPTPITAPLTPEVKADALRAEQDAYLRRVSVCTELRRVALERGDNDLARQADELERQAAVLYNARVAGLGVARVKAPLPESAATSSAFADLSPPTQTATAKAQRLTAPSAPIPGSSTAAQVREVNP
jgi:hypothetical protein